MQCWWMLLFAVMKEAHTILIKKHNIQLGEEGLLNIGKMPSNTLDVLSKYCYDWV